MAAACGGSTSGERSLTQTGGNSSVDAGVGGSTSTGGRSGSGAVGTDGGAGAIGGTGAIGGSGAVAGIVGAGATLPCMGDIRCGPSGVIPPGPSLCGGVECGADETCCLTSMKCVSARDPDACDIPVPPAPDPNGRTPCASNANCTAGEFCATDGLSCGGGGFCTSKTNCGSSGGSLFCGCDGKTYPDLQTACLAGVRAIYRGGCGDEVVVGGGGASAGVTRTLCGSDAQCPTGEHCCAITGYCLDEAHAGLCAYPPPGTTRACLSNADCFTESEYCDGAGCDGPGGCKRLGTCGAVLDPVCGCDGKSYVNAPCAASAGVRIASQGQCENAP
jgi:hypothetical protein